MRKILIVILFLLMIPSTALPWTEGSQAGGDTTSSSPDWRWKSDSGDSNLDLEDVDNDVDVVTIEQGADAGAITIDVDGDVNLGYDLIFPSLTCNATEEANSLCVDGTNIYYYGADTNKVDLTSSAGNEYWTQTGSDLSRATGVVSIGTTPAAAIQLYSETTDSDGTVTSSVTGKVIGTESATSYYGVRGESTGVSLNNYGLYGIASGATNNNYGLWVDSGDALFDEDIIITNGSITNNSADGTHYINASNTSNPSSPNDGDLQYRNDRNQWLTYNDDTVAWNNIPQRIFDTSAPAASDCDTLAERGRPDVIDTTNNLMYICAGTVGWQKITTVDVLTPVTWLLTEDFEASPGYDTAAWTESGVDTINEDYTSTVLLGSESLFLDTTGAEVKTLNTFTANNTIYIYFMFQFDAEGTSTIFRVRDSSDTVLGEITLATNVLRIKVGSDFTDGATTLSVDTTYHVWADWGQGSGNATGNLYVETSATKGAAEATANAGTVSTQYEKGEFRLGAAGTNIIFDKLRIDDADISSDPT